MIKYMLYAKTLIKNMIKGGFIIFVFFCVLYTFADCMKQFNLHSVYCFFLEDHSHKRLFFAQFCVFPLLQKCADVS